MPVAERVCARGETGEPMKRTRRGNGSVTMKQIAELAEVSLGTVSHVVNGSASVRDKLRQRVLDAIQGLGYQPSQLARGLRRKSTNMLGMVIPDITNPFFPAVVRGVEDVAYKSGYRVVLCNTDNNPTKEQQYLDDLQSYHPAGVLVIPSAGSNLSAEISSNMAQNTPIVCIDRCPNDWAGDAVLVANEEGAYLATQYLIRMGHRMLGVITGPLHLQNASERLKGFERATEEAKIPVPQEYKQAAEFDRISGYRAARRLLSLLPKPTAIFACNDLMALGTLQAAREQRIRVPGELSIMGFDNLDLTELTDPPLSTVYQSGYQMGITSANLIMKRLEGKAGEATRVILPVELKVRNSVAPPRSAEETGKRKAGAGKIQL